MKPSNIMGGAVVTTDADGTVALNPELPPAPTVKPAVTTCTGCALLELGTDPQEVPRKSNPLAQRLMKVNNRLLYELGDYRSDIIALRAQFAAISEKHDNLDRCYENSTKMVRELSERIYELEFPLWLEDSLILNIQ